MRASSANPGAEWGTGPADVGELPRGERHELPIRELPRVPSVLGMRTTPKNRLVATAALAALVSAMTACAGSSSSPSTTTAAEGVSAQSAADAAELVLRVGTDDDANTPGGQQIEHFADEVARLSGGAVSIEPVWHAAGDTSRWDQAVGRMLLDGELDLAMVPSRAWDDLGVTSLTALNAPFLVTTDTLVAEIVADEELVEQLTSGLPSVGATALGLFPEGLRHPFGVQGALLGAEDYEGGVVRTAWSRTTNAMFEAFGATTSDEPLDPTTMIGTESSFRLTPAGIATGNVVFYPKINVLSLSTDVESGLTEEQRTVLTDAAAATAAWVGDTLPTDVQAAQTFCEEAGRISAATPEQIDSLVAATRGVVEDLRDDPTTGGIIDAITVMAADDPAPERVTSCPESRDNLASELNGVYTFTVTEEAIRAAGGTDQDKIDENTGEFTLTFRDGSIQATQVYSQGPNAGTTWRGAWSYTFDGKALKIFYSHDPGAWTTMRVKIRKDGTLEFSKVVDGAGPEEQALSEAWYTSWPRQDG